MCCARLRMHAGGIVVCAMLLLPILVLGGCAAREVTTSEAPRTAASTSATVQQAPNVRFIQTPFSDTWREVSSLDAAMSYAEDPSLTAKPALVPSLQPARVFVSSDEGPGVLLVYAEATMTISPKIETGVESGYASLAQGAEAGKVVREFEGYPAFGAEKGTTVGDPSGTGAWSYATTTNLAWTADGHEYALQSDALTLMELQELARRLFPTIAGR